MRISPLSRTTLALLALLLFLAACRDHQLREEHEEDSSLEDQVVEPDIEEELPGDLQEDHSAEVSEDLQEELPPDLRDLPDDGPSCELEVLSSHRLPNVAEPVTFSETNLVFVRDGLLVNSVDEMALYSYEAELLEVQQGRAAIAGDGHQAIVLAVLENGGSELLLVGEEADRLIVETSSREDKLVEPMYWDVSVPQRQIHGERLSWYYPTGEKIMIEDGPGSRLVTTPIGWANAPIVSEYGVAWIGDGLNHDVFLWTPDRETTRITNSERWEQRVAFTSDALWWTSEDGLHRRNHNSGLSEDIISGVSCNAIDAEGDWLAVACIGTDMGFQQEVRVLDPEGNWHTPSNGAMVVGPMVSQGRVAWIEYDDPSALCTPTEITPGRLMVWKTGLEPLLVSDTIGTPCLCCAMYWPMLRFTFSWPYLAWNYAGATADPMMGLEYGLATLSQSCD